MAADPNDARTKRRKAMGDDPNKVSMAPQPIPGAPQDQKAGNVMNYPAMDVNGQMGQKMGSGLQYPYGDMAIDAETQLKTGGLGIASRSKVPQNMVPGTRNNAVFGYNTAPGPTKAEEGMMEPAYDIAQAQGQTMPGGPQKLFGMGKAPYAVSPMGPTGTGQPAPGALPAQMQYSMPDDLPMQGGMSTGRGGGRNKGKN